MNFLIVDELVNNFIDTWDKLPIEELTAIPKD